MSEKPSRKPRTRGNRDGRPYQRASDGKWVATVYLPNGKRKPVYGDTRKEADDKRKQAQREIDDNQPVTAGRTDTVEHYLTRVWLPVTLPQRVEAGKLAASTLDSYRDTCEKHVIPHLGRVRLVDLSTTHIRAWLLELARKPSGRSRKKLRPGETKLPPPETLSTRTVAYAHAVLRKALNDAVDDESVKRNVCLLVDAPTVERKPPRELSKDEVRALLGAAAEHRLWAYWLLLLALGLRRGEGLGLRWEDVDLDAGTVRLVESVQRMRGEVDEETGRRKGRLVRKGLKTQASKATLKLPAFAVAALREHRTGQEDEQDAARLWVDEGLVFTTTIGTALEPRNVNRMWEDICAAAGVERCRIHDLRHACGSFLFADGVDLKVIQGVLRHTRLSTTAEIYVHLLEEVKDAAAEAMDGMLVDLAGERRKRRRSAS
ncbi:integrase [Actinomadura coerulea]|uniref:Integrase n=1 Tax=Actinomadura coerulea TaxID=46159 RepID=A0A7X0L259_9ACTN|nr:tyrosine-type recombinase/integrase [Actinomadura coerulea]MBB6398899.1 integrase [Actinomadura coerulea]GGP98419.1 site-specific integrase [Actinomadura coerulea]